MAHRPRQVLVPDRCRCCALTCPRPSEALRILADLHGKGDPDNALVQLEYAEIQEQVTFERTEGAKSYMDLFKPGISRRVGLGCALQMWSQLSGINVMMSALFDFFYDVEAIN